MAIFGIAVERMFKLTITAEIFIEVWAAQVNCTGLGHMAGRLRIALLSLTDVTLEDPADSLCS